jgi:hypothetical protein
MVLFFYSLIIKLRKCNGGEGERRVKLFSKGNQNIDISCRRRCYSSLAKQHPLTKNLIIDPLFITGFSDAESSFSIGVIRSNERRLG